MGALSIQTITALTEVITGGPGGSHEQPIGTYRSASELTRFFGAANVAFDVGGCSRGTTIHDKLVFLNRQKNGLPVLTTVIEQVSDPREYPRMPGKVDAVVAYLNECLTVDGCEPRLQRGRYRLVKTDTNIQVTAALREHTERLDLETVERDFHRALGQAEQDPEDAITAACSALESICTCLVVRPNAGFRSALPGIFGVCSSSRL